MECSYKETNRGVEIVFFLLVQGQVNGHNVLVQIQIKLYLSVLKQLSLSKTV